MIRLIDNELTSTLTEPSMKVLGKKISKMEKEERLGQIELVINENTSKEKKADSEFSNGLTDLGTNERFWRITYMVKVS